MASAPRERRRSTAADAWPFAGRSTEFDELRAELVDDRRSLVLIGPTGIGKSRMRQELERAAHAAGLHVTAATATRVTADIPFAAIAGLIPAVLDRPASAADSRAGLIARCVAALAVSPDSSPPLLAIDDLQFLDPPSAAVVYQAVASGRCQLLGTVGSEHEPGLDVLGPLWSDGTVRRYDMFELPEASVEELLVGALGDPVDGGTVVRLTARSRGNALLLRELVRSALDAGGLENHAGVWRLTGTFALSPRLAEIVGTRIGELAADEREALELVAMSEPVGVVMLERIVPGDLVESLEARGLLRSWWDDRRLFIGLRHPIYAEWLLARISGMRRRRLARRLADALAHDGARRRADTLRLATWRLDSGQAKIEQGLMLRAARMARNSYDFPLARRLARAAIAHDDPFEAELLTSELMSLQGLTNEAQDSLAALAEQAEGAEQRMRVALARLDVAIFGGHAKLGLELCAEAENAIEPGIWRDEISARKSGLLFAVEGPPAAARAAAEILERSTPDVAPGYAGLVACLAYGRMGRIGDALRVAHTARRPASSAVTPTIYPWLQTFFRCDALLYAGRFKEAENIARHEYELAVREQSIEAQAYFGFQLAKAVGERGNARHAFRYAREASTLFRELGRPILLEPCLVDVTVSLALSGDTLAASAALRELEELDVSPSYYPIEVLRARAWEAIARGELAIAREQAITAAELGEELGDRVGALDALHLLARLGRAHEARGAAIRVADGMEGELAPARLAHITALDAHDCDQLDAASATFEELGADLLAAESAAAAATAAIKTGTPQRIATLRRRAAQLRELVPNASTPGLSAVTARAELTPAETDAALLAAEGYSNRQIADRLFLSVRTVEGQLQRCYEKLHVTRRQDLAAALREGRHD